jgi:hypothetical protein
MSNFQVLRLSVGNPTGDVIGTYENRELADATRKLLNETTPSYLLYFFIIGPPENPLALADGMNGGVT